MRGYRLLVIGSRLKLFLVFVPFSLFTVTYCLLPQKVSAQSAISLSITPPIVEVMIAPGKDIKQTFTISNDGGNTLISPKVVYFTPSDTAGNVDLTEDLAPDWIKYDKTPFNLNSGQKHDFKISIEPPADAEEIDHFLTLIFENDVPTDVLGQTSTLFTSQIGSNILLTISKDGNPKKSAQIVEFSAPKIIDSSFGKINYNLILKNNGNSFWKPNGKIIIDDELLKIAPQNILSGYSRKLLCIKDETLTDCVHDKQKIIGIIKSNTEFQIDDDSKIYKAEITTYSFPFVGLTILIFLLTTFNRRRIFKLWRKEK
jgi:hypothetical protein